MKCLTFFVSFFVSFRFVLCFFACRTPCLPEANNKTSGTILAQVVILRCSKKANNIVAPKLLMKNNLHLIAD